MFKANDIDAQVRLVGSRGFLMGMGAVTAGFPACTLAPRAPDVGSLYQYTDENDPALRRPPVKIPGLLGSRLRSKSPGAFVWGGKNRLSVDLNTEEGLRLLALPMGSGNERLKDLKDVVRSAGVLRKESAPNLLCWLLDQPRQRKTTG